MPRRQDDMKRKRSMEHIVFVTFRSSLQNTISLEKSFNGIGISVKIIYHRLFAASDILFAIECPGYGNKMVFMQTNDEIHFA